MINNTDDIELWQRLQRGEREALDVLYTKYFQSLFTYGMRLLQEEEGVYDCIQNLFVKLWVDRKKLSSVDKVKNYLISSLRNGITNYRISENKFQKVEVEGDMHFDLKFTVESEFIKKEEQEEKAVNLTAAMNQLTARQKEILYLKYYEEMDYTEIAAVMDMTLKGTYKLNARALESLRLIMGVDKALLLAMLYTIKS
ncbi:RNA polymerase sigma factor [Pedobacter sp. MW01-1-1]|uniref:RNA polymerase sigma factor n=1 Tax=Pedobacter sp. MW01-1-1 TaxID=3383027 RepID=UPI003FEF7A16